MNTQLPRISVITLSLNNAEALRKNIESVLAQGYENFEHIVIDAASSDATVEILKSFEHLQWVSEPDRGRAHALNKGFLRATGEILLCLHSHETLSAGVFHKIIPLLTEYPIVMGSCDLLDPDGRLQERVPNLERNYYDLLRYWVHQANPTPSSIFFTRVLADQLVLPNGDFFDEDLRVAPELDFWLRVAERKPLMRRVEDVLSCSTQKLENRIGVNQKPVFRELSRIFRRHENALCEVERRICFLIPSFSANALLERTIESISFQLFQNFEVLVVPVESEKEEREALRHQVENLSEKFPRLALRMLQYDGGDFIDAIQLGARRARSPLVAVLPPGSLPQTDFAFHASSLFEHDSMGLALVNGVIPGFPESIADDRNGTKTFSAKALFREQFIPPVFVARSAALRELQGFWSREERGFAFMQELLLKLSYRSWQINVVNNLVLSSVENFWSQAEEAHKLLSVYAMAKLISDLEDERGRDPFARVRDAHGFGLQIPEDMTLHARQVLGSIPPRWEFLPEDTSIEGLRLLCANSRNFPPHLRLLSRALEEAGQNAESAEVAKEAKKLFGGHSFVK